MIHQNDNTSLQTVQNTLTFQKYGFSPALPVALGALPGVRNVYAERLATWEAWEEVSNSAQG